MVTSQAVVQFDLVSELKVLLLTVAQAQSLPGSAPVTLVQCP